MPAYIAATAAAPLPNLRRVIGFIFLSLSMPVRGDLSGPAIYSKNRIGVIELLGSCPIWQALGFVRASSSPGIYIQLADRRPLTLKREVGGSLGQDKANNVCF